MIFPFRAADRPAELVREHLQSEQHHQSLQRRQPEGTGGQEEEEKELGEDVNWKMKYLLEKKGFRWFFLGFRLLIYYH